MHRTAALTTLLGLAASLAPLPSCLGGSCEGIPLAAVDYDDDASWLCLPDREDICSAERHIYEALPSGAVVERFEGPAEDPPIDCFYVYPTVDLRPRLGVQEDLTALDRPRKAAATQFAAFSAACRPFAPVYRQVSIGTYLYGERRSDPCFEVAYSDVLAAFERYLERDNDGRGFALVGHSQGGQHVSRLIHERIEGDPELRARMVVAMPIGWPIGTDAGGITGGSFDDVPVCQDADEFGCVLGYRSFGAGNELPPFDERSEGTQLVCTNPASPDDADQTATLRAAIFPADTDLTHRPAGVPEDADAFVSFEGGYDARCVDGDDGARALEIRWAPAPGDARDEPLELSGLLRSGDGGTHIYDLAWGQTDLVRDLERRAAAWLAATG